MTSDIDEKTKALAIKLVSSERMNSDYALIVTDGFTVPMWLTYVSRAKQMLLDKDLLSGK